MAQVLADQIGKATLTHVLLTSPTQLLAHLRDRGPAPALITEQETLGYDELADRVAALAPQYGGGRRLVGLAMANDITSVVHYLAALAAGHAVVLASPCRLAEVTAGVQPGVLVADGVMTVVDGQPADLHPDLCLLLSTSGSTGSPKLVRLSYQNLRSNAAAIAECLAIRPTDRAVTALPLPYSYGLSVLHSHLLAGASVVLTDRSASDREFADLLARHRVTTLSGVPHTFDLLERTGGLDARLPALRTLTSAGGRMAPQAVRRWAERGQRSGFDFYVMYGQTEATARMAVLPPDRAARHPAAVGVPIPGGEVRIDPVADAPDGAGELVYRGPNVMMGYAQTPADLARGPELDELRTGDLARLTGSGLIEIVGRRARFAKVFGLRIDLGAVQAAAGEDVWCVEGDGCLLVGCLGDPRPVHSAVAGASGLPPAAVVVRRLTSLPRTSVGKPDYRALREQVAGAPAPAGDSVAAIYAAVLGLDRVRPGDTFASLGGDSMSYVACAAALERVIGELPRQWHRASVAELAATSPVETGRPRRWRVMDTSVVLRALAIIAIVGSHIGVLDIRGGAHLLIAVAGWNFARFRLQTALPVAAERRAALASVIRIVAPSALWLSLLVVFSSDYGPSLLFGTNLFGPAEAAPQWRYWYVEALVTVLMASLALLALPGVQARCRRNPFAWAVAALAAGLALRWTMVAQDGPAQLYTPVAVAWLFAAGWALAQAGALRQRLLVIGIVAIGMVGYFDDPRRAALVLAGLALVGLRPTLRVPAAAVGALTALAAASLWIYLTHWQVYPPLDSLAGGWVALAASLAAGAAAHHGFERAWRALGRRRGQTAGRCRAAPRTVAA